MQTETLRISRPRRTGWVLRIVMAAAIIVAASWYLLPKAFEQLPDVNEPSRPMMTTDDVNLRAGPGTSYDVIAVIPIGTEVAAHTEPEQGFIQVAAQGQRGWMSAAYLSAPGSVLAQSQTVHAAETTRPAPTEPAVAYEPPVAPEPTAVPTYQPVAAQYAPVQPKPQPGEKWIEVNRTAGTVTLHNGEIVVAQFNALVGKDMSADGYYSTALGTFYVHVKEKALVETPFAEGVYLTDFVGFDPHRSNGFHSPVRDSGGNVVITGGTTTLGCVRLSEDDAIFLFNFATIGMRVEVHD